MLVAQIAYNILSPAALSAVDPLISYLAAEYPQSPDFVTSSAWPDDLKTLGVTQVRAPSG